MSWAKLDDKFHSHPKVLEAGDAATGLFSRALSYASDHLTEGFVSAAWLRTATTRAATVKEVTAASLWSAVVKGETCQVKAKGGELVTVVMPADGFFIRDFLQYNPTRAQVEAERAKTAARVAAWRAQKAQAAGSNEEGNGVTEQGGNSVTYTVGNGLPDPARPVPKNLPNEPQQESVLDPVVEVSEDEQPTIEAFTANVTSRWLQPDFPMAADDDIPF